MFDTRARSLFVALLAFGVCGCTMPMKIEREPLKFVGLVERAHVEPSTVRSPYADLKTLDGVWRRDDGKRYVLCGTQGQQLDPGFYACRVETRARPGELRFTLRFVERDAQREAFAVSVRALGYDAAADAFSLEWGWVELDDDGRISKRGSERRTLTRERWLSDYERHRLRAALACHVSVDSALRDGRRAHARQLLARGAWTDPRSAGEVSLRDRAALLRARRRPVATTLEASARR